MFGKRLSPLTYKDVTTALISLGYELSPKKATAHEKWVLQLSGSRKVVIVDKHLSPFDKKLIKLMAQQAGLSAHDFHALCKCGGVAAPKLAVD